jgi:hypothetical protein
MQNISNANGRAATASTSIASADHFGDLNPASAGFFYAYVLDENARALMNSFSDSKYAHSFEA